MDKNLGFGRVLKQYQTLLRILDLDIFWIPNDGAKNLKIQQKSLHVLWRVLYKVYQISGSC
jgi:hypothetical protein